MKIDVYKIGSKVELTENVHGTIVSVGIHGDNVVTYECGWWSGRSYDAKWFHPHEITVILGDKTKIGFV